MSAFKSLAIIQVPDEVQNRQNQEIVNRVNQLSSVQFLDGRLIANVTVGTSSTPIEHKLGRNFQGWFLVRKRSAGDVREDAQGNTALYLNLISSAQVSVDVWVF